MLVSTLGLREYTEIWALQKCLVEKRLKDQIQDTLLLVEHLPVYTCGASSKTPIPSYLPHPIYQVERGGDLTYHGPGQLVVYPIFHLGEKGLRPKAFLRALESMLIEALRPLGIKAEILRGFTGVWYRGRKIASIGIAVKNQVSYHGFALNISCDLGGFAMIHPCNLESEQIANLQDLLGQPMDMVKVTNQVAETCLSYFGPAIPTTRPRGPIGVSAPGSFAGYVLGPRSHPSDRIIP
jgi:lipoate-protein ligase B